MLMSKRERMVAWTALAAVVLLVGDRFVLKRIRVRRDAMRNERARLVADLDRARLLFERQRQLAPRWQELSQAGLLADPDKAESEVLHAIRTWSQDSSLVLSSLRPEAVIDHGALCELTFQASATGSMRGVARFLFSLESAARPIRVTDLQLGTRKEGTDDLSLQLRVSALCRARTDQETGADKPKGGGSK
jgi:Tfp pilus assembly protein PilO